MATSVRACASVELTNTRFPQMTGVADDGPGRAVVHLTCAVLENFTGRFVSGEEPLKAGPRHCGHWAAWRGAPTAKKATSKARKSIFEEVIRKKWRATPIMQA